MHWNQCSRNGCIQGYILHLGEKDLCDHWDRRPNDLASKLSHKYWHIAPRFMPSEPDFTPFPSFKALPQPYKCLCKDPFSIFGRGDPQQLTAGLWCHVSWAMIKTPQIPVKSIMGNNLRVLSGQEAFSSHSSPRPQEGSRVPWGMGLVCILDNMVIILFL